MKSKSIKNVLRVLPPIHVLNEPHAFNLLPFTKPCHDSLCVHGLNILIQSLTGYKSSKSGHMEKAQMMCLWWLKLVFFMEACVEFESPIGQQGWRMYTFCPCMCGVWMQEAHLFTRTHAHTLTQSRMNDNRTAHVQIYAQLNIPSSRSARRPENQHN
jgi:hypothetical protein